MLAICCINEPIYGRAIYQIYILMDSECRLALNQYDERVQPSYSFSASVLEDEVQLQRSPRKWHKGELLRFTRVPTTSTFLKQQCSVLSVDEWCAPDGGPENHRPLPDPRTHDGLQGWLGSTAGAEVHAGHDPRETGQEKSCASIMVALILNKRG